MILSFLFDEIRNKNSNRFILFIVHDISMSHIDCVVVLYQVSPSTFVVDIILIINGNYHKKYHVSIQNDDSNYL